MDWGRFAMLPYRVSYWIGLVFMCYDRFCVVQAKWCYGKNSEAKSLLYAVLPHGHLNPIHLDVKSLLFRISFIRTEALFVFVYCCFVVVFIFIFVTINNLASQRRSYASWKGPNRGYLSKYITPYHLIFIRFALDVLERA